MLKWLLTSVNKKKGVYIKLGEPELRCLIRGGEVTFKKSGVHMILADIGFIAIDKLVGDAMDSKEHYKPYESEE